LADTDQLIYSIKGDFVTKKRLFAPTAALLLTFATATAYAEGEYATFKAGGFLPNGNGSSTGDLKDYDTGLNVEVAAGFTLAPYVAIEAATGYFGTSRSYNYNFDSNLPTKDTVSGVPLTLSIKGIVGTERADFFAGAGAGYYFCILDQKTPTLNMTQHGNALGYHIVGGIDFKINEQWALGAEAKWFTTKPKFENIRAIGQKTEWEMGGTLMNLTVKYRF
jgi:outer membrane protein W